MKKIGLVIGLVVALILLILPAPRLEQASSPVLSDADLVDPAVLSAWILDAEQGYVLIDLRAEEVYLAEAIKTAMSLPLASIDAATIESLPEHRRLILYAADTEEALPAWQAIKPHRPAVYVLEGGLAAWREVVLDPAEPAADASEDAWAAYQERLAVANYYLGKTDESPVVRERVVRPVLRPHGAGTANEGC